MNSKKKVLFIIQLPPPVHGASIVNKLVHKSDKLKVKFDCHYINLTTAKDVSDIGKWGLSKLFSMVRIWGQTLRCYRKNKFQLVYLTLSPHGLAFYKDGFLAVLLKLCGAKMVFHLHGKGIKSRFNRNVFNKFLYKLVFRKAKVIHLAPCLYADISDLVSKKNVWFVANGIDLKSQVTHSQNGQKRILYLSNMQETKGSFDLLRAADILVNRKVDFQIDFVGKWHGDSEFKKKWESFLQDQNLEEYVTYHGPKYNEEKESFLNAAAIFVLPTFYENECFPISILEAMSYGIPVISTNEGAISDIVVEGETGYLVSKNAPSQIADVLQDLLNDEGKRVQMGNKARERFHMKYTSNIFEENLAKTLEEIIA